MATPNTSSPEVLSGEILAQAMRECDEILRRARQEAKSLLAAAEAEADKIHRETLDATRVEAARRSELILATVPVEAGRMRAERREALLENIREEARRRLLEQNSDADETIVTLATDAIRRMAGMDFVLKISAADYGVLGGKLASEIRQRLGRSNLKLAISADAAVTDRGVIVQDAGGIQIWDNRLQSRLERLWPELRRQIAVHTSLVVKNTPVGGAA